MVLTWLHSLTLIMLTDGNFLLILQMSSSLVLKIFIHNDVKKYCSNSNSSKFQVLVSIHYDNLHTGCLEEGRPPQRNKRPKWRE